jgi:predicted nucleic acid-binding protein
VLPLDASVMREGAKLMHRKSNTLGQDTMLAATARVHRLQMVKRNTSDFAHFQTSCLNPFEFKSV